MHDDAQAKARSRALDVLVNSLQTSDSLICATVVLWQTEDLMVHVLLSAHPEMAYEKDGVEMSNAAHMADLLEEAAKKLRATLG